jgi:hypothetical protein
MDSAALDSLVDEVASDLAAALGGTIEGELVSATRTNVLTARR